MGRLGKSDTYIRSQILERAIIGQYGNIFGCTSPFQLACLHGLAIIFKQTIHLVLCDIYIA